MENKPTRMGVSHVIIVLLIVYSAMTTRFALDEDYHGWPAVTRCGICDHRVWIWQDYERREWKPKIDNPQGLAVNFTTMSSLLHTGCEGTPKRDPIKVRAY